MKTLLASSLFCTLALFACKGELEGDDPAKTPAAEKKTKSNVVKLTTAVPYGKHLHCKDVFPDAALFATTMGVELSEEIKDQGKTNSSATFVCSFIKAGEPPESPKELKTLEDKYGKLGVVPGDEYCQISGYCSSANDEDTFRSSCEKEGNELSELAGQFACLRATEKGVEYAYTYKFIEPDTKCIVEAMAGPSVNERELVQNCALAAREAIIPSSAAKPF